MEDESKDAETDEETRELAAEIPWITPAAGGRIHILRPYSSAKSGLPDTPLCRDFAFLTGFCPGTGAAAATDLKRKWCDQCLERLFRVNRKLAEHLI